MAATVSEGGGGSAPAPVVVKPKPKPKPRKRASEAELERARKRAKAIAAAKKVAARNAAILRRETQSAVWRRLQERAQALRQQQRDVIGTVAGTRKITALPSELKNLSATAERLRKQQEAIRQRAAELEYVQKGGSDFSAKRGKTLERLVREARARQVASGGTDLDTEYIRALDKAYQTYVENVGSTFRKKAAELQKYFNVDEKGNFIKPKSDKDAEAARKLYDSKDFQAYLSEYNRLFVGGDKAPGTFDTTMKARDEIAVQQRQVLYATAKQTLFAKTLAARKLGDPDDKAYAQKLQADWDNGGKYQYDAAKAEIDPAKTSLKMTKIEGGKVVWTRRTVDEEFEFRKAQYMAEMRRQYREYEKAALARKTIMRQEDRANGPALRQQRQDAEAIAASMRQNGFRSVTTPEQLQKTVATAVDTWATKNRSAFLSKTTQEMLNGEPRERAAAMNRLDYKRYLSAWKAQTARYYRAQGAEPPGWLDTIMEVPGVKGALDLFSAPFGAIGGLSKIAASTLANAPAEFIAAGDNFTYEALPPVQQRRVDAEVKRLIADPAFRRRAEQVFKSKGALSDGRVAQLAREVALDTVANAFVKTPAGLAWSNQTGQMPGGLGITTGRNTTEQQRITSELRSFYENFYEKGTQSKDGAVAGLGSIVKGLSEYGSMPFTPDSILPNLAVGIAFDPLNGIPLKATTWAARARYAIEATQDVSGFNRAQLAARKWATVTEVQLRFEKRFTSMLKELDNGADAEVVTDKLLAGLAGIRDVKEGQKVVEDTFRRLGIDRKAVSEHGLRSLTQELILDALDARKVNYEGVAAQARKANLQADELKKAAEAERVAALKEADRLRTAAEQKEQAAAVAGRARVEARYAEKKVAVAKRVPAAAAPPPRPARAVPEEPELLRSTGEPGVHRLTRDVTPEYRAIDDAIASEGRFVTDGAADRARPYNRRGREVAEYLQQRGYRETRDGYWEPPRRGTAQNADPVLSGRVTTTSRAIENDVLRLQRMVDDFAQVTFERAPTEAAIGRTVARFQRMLRASDRTLSPHRGPVFDALNALDPDLRKVVVHRLNRARAETSIKRSLGELVRLTTDSGTLTEESAETLARAVESVRQMDGGPALLERLANEQGENLLASRLAQFVHEARPASVVGETVEDTMSARALHILNGMSEEQWLAREQMKASRALKAATSPAAKAKAQFRLDDVARARKVLQVSKTNEGYISKSQRVAAGRRVRGFIDRAHAMISPKYLTPYITSVDGALTEQGRSEYRMWRTAVVSEGLGKVPMDGSVSRAYRSYGRRLDAVMNRPLAPDSLKQFGIEGELAQDVTPLDILSNLDEFTQAIRVPEFEAFVEEMREAVTAEIRRVSRRKGYSVEQYLSDRMMHGKVYDVDNFERDNRAVTLAINKARDGAKAPTISRLKHRPGDAMPQPDVPLTELVESDLRAIVAKSKTLRQLGVDPHAYNEARKVLKNSMVRKNTGLAVLARAEQLALADMDRLGLTVDSPGWDAAWRESLDKHFLADRDMLNRREAAKLLETLAMKEMYGSPPEAVIAEFEARYGLDEDVRGFKPPDISLFQKQTLEEAAKKHLKVTDLSDKEQVKIALRANGQSPPFENRARMREWLEKYGAWSPRKTQDIEAGKQSWSLRQEGEYYDVNWGEVPQWADEDFYKDIRFDEVAYGQALREMGLFNRNMEARLATQGMTREQQAKLLVRGSDELNIHPARDLEVERKYYAERFEHLAVDAEGNFIAFPWLMNLKEIRKFQIAQATEAALKNVEKVWQSQEEIDLVVGIIEERLGKYIDEVIGSKKEATFEDMFTVTSNIVHDILQDPRFLARDSKTIGHFLRTQAAIRRALVFSQIGFATTNIIDSFVKEAWIGFTSRGFRTGRMPSATALNLNVFHFGWERGTQLLKDAPVHGTARIRRGLETGSNFDKAIGVTELPAQAAGMAERAAKLRLAQGMYDGVYAQTLRRLKAKYPKMDAAARAKLADASAKDYIKAEVDRLWPTQGDGPIERLINQLSPFISYNLKNKVMFIGELLGHPSLFNYFDKIGDAIEQYNVQNYVAEHPEDPQALKLPLHERRLLELPWAPGVWLDLGAFSDASRGLAPLYKMGKGGMSPRDFTAQWVRLVGPADQNIVGGALNALGVPNRMGWKAIIGENGFPTGQYEQVPIPWMAPWGDVADATNSIWPWELWNHFQEVAGDGLTAQEATVIGAQALFFGGLKYPDRGVGLNAYYFALREKNPEAAKAFLQTADGAALQSWWLDRSGRTKEFYTPKEVKDLLDPPASFKDDSEWFHSQPVEFQNLIKRDLDALRKMRQKWDHAIWGLTPGTAEFKDAVLQSATEKYEFYRTHPEMYEYEAFSKTPAQWAAQLNDWVVDDQVQAFFDIEAPKREDFKSAKAWQEAVAEWRLQRATYLKSFPRVAQRIGEARDAVERIWQDTEQGWFDTMDRIGTRSIAIEAAKQAGDYDLLDQLYLASELDYLKLQEDVAVSYFDPTTDFASLPRGVEGPATLLPGDLLKRVKVLPDFDKWRFDRASLDERKEIERSKRYGEGMKEVVALAKAGGKFDPAVFVREMKKRPNLLTEYFNRNPGKREQWAQTDEYIRLISKFGQLMKAGKFDAGNAYFERLPEWVKDRYYKKHPERRRQIAKNGEYMTWMKRWTAFYRKRDYEGGADFFDKMPKWVQDQYFSKHPDSGMRGGGSTGSSPYSRAMGQWVKLLQENKDDEAKAYFDSLPQAYKDRYYAKHPDAKLRADIRRTGQLAQYFAADDANRAVYLRENPEFAKWLKKNDTSEAQRRMMILVAYQSLDDQWLKRVFREKYPEVFSQEAKGEQSLRKTYRTLAENPEMLPAFEKWVAAVWESYAQNMQHSRPQPKPVVSDHSRTRQHGSDRRAHRGKSAAWVRLHSLS